MSDAAPRWDTSTGITDAGASPDLEALLEEIRDMPCASLFTLVARQLAKLDPEVSAEVRPLGILFRYRQISLCELSLYGELFIARVGPGLAVEVRVRSEALALLVLDEVIRTYVHRRHSQAGEGLPPVCGDEPSVS